MSSSEENLKDLPVETAGVGGGDKEDDAHESEASAVGGADGGDGGGGE